MFQNIIKIIISVSHGLYKPNAEARKLIRLRRARLFPACLWRAEQGGDFFPDKKPVFARGAKKRLKITPNLRQIVQTRKTANRREILSADETDAINGVSASLKRRRKFVIVYSRAIHKCLGGGLIWKLPRDI
jgi:hypothetical protein